MRTCPKCKSIDPPTKIQSDYHFTETCKHIIGYEKFLFWNIPIYCNSINDFDEDDTWIYIYKVEKFVYNGFVVYPPKKGWGHYESYTATFKCWTNDPGIAICKCSDGKERLIPSCCLHGDKYNFPEQKKHRNIIFGTPFTSK